MGGLMALVDLLCGAEMGDELVREDGEGSSEEAEGAGEETIGKESAAW